MTKHILMALSLLLLISQFSFSQEIAYEGLKIKSIEIKGLQNAKFADVRSLIDLREGQPYSSITVNENLKRLFSMDMFKSADLEISNDNGGLILNFIVKENKYIRNVRFEGNNSERSDELLKNTDLTSESFYTEDKIKRASIAIINKYNSDGYIEATVTNQLVVQDEARNTYDVLFKVKEGNKIVIEKVVITGNKQVPANEIKGIMKTKEKFLIFNFGIFKEDEFAKDKETIIEFYQHKGFLDAEIKRFTNVIEELDNDKHKAMVVYLDLNEGEKFFVGKTSIKNFTIFTTNELYSYLDVKEGEVYDKTKMELIRYNLFNKYSDSGHVFANVSLVMNRKTNNIVDSEFVLVEGPRAHVEKVTVSGNTKTMENVIKRELVLQEGELYVQKKVRQSVEHLSQLQFFSDVKPNFLPGSAEGLIDLDFNVEEQRTGMISFGLGYGTESGFNVTGQLAERNLFGTGRAASIKGTYGQTSQSISIDYTEPWIFNQPLAAGVSLSFARQMYQNIPTDADHDGVIDGTIHNWTNDPSTITITNNNYVYYDQFSLSFNLARAFWIYWKASAGIGFSMYRYTLDSYDIQNIFMNSGYATIRDRQTNSLNNPLTYYTDHWGPDTNLTTQLSNKNWGFKNDLMVGLELNSTDHPLTPLYGNKFSLLLWYFGGFLGGDIHYLRPKISFDWYLNPIWKFVFALHASSEFILPQFGQSKAIYTYSDQLYFDGSYEMRGWMGYAPRGEGKAFYSIEFRSQIYDFIWGVLFCDVGHLWTSYVDYSPFKPDGYIGSFGIGVQVNIPMIPIRIYMARLMEYDSLQGGWRFTSSASAGNSQKSPSQWFFDDWTPVINITGLF